MNRDFLIGVAVGLWFVVFLIFFLKLMGLA